MPRPVMIRAPSNLTTGAIMSDHFPRRLNPAVLCNDLSRRQFLVGAVTAASAFALPRVARAQLADAPVVINNVALFDGKGGPLQSGMNVLVQGEKISEIAAGQISPPEGATVIDGSGRTLMPGMIDNHTHLFMTGSSQAEMMAPDVTFEDLNAIAAREANLMLLRGFTSVRDVGGPVFELKRMIDKGEVIGPRIYPSGAMISQTSGHGDFRTLLEKSRRFGGTISAGELLGVAFIADGRDEVLTATRENLRQGATQIKVMAGGGAASAYDPLDVSQYTFDELLASVQAADDWGTYVAVHAYTDKAVRRSLEAGVKCIEHGQLAGEETIMMIADMGAYLSLQVLNPAPPTQTPDVIKKKQMVVDGTDTAFTLARKHKGQTCVRVGLPFQSQAKPCPRRRCGETAAMVHPGRGFGAADLWQRRSAGALRPAQPL